MFLLSSPFINTYENMPSLSLQLVLPEQEQVTRATDLVKLLLAIGIGIVTVVVKVSRYHVFFFKNICSCSLTRSLTHSLTHSLTQPTRPFIHPPTTLISKLNGLWETADFKLDEIGDEIRGILPVLVVLVTYVVKIVVQFRCSIFLSSP